MRKSCAHFSLFYFTLGPVLSGALDENLRKMTHRMQLITERFAMALDLGIRHFRIILHQQNGRAKALKIIGAQGFQIHAFAIDRHEIDLRASWNRFGQDFA